MSTIIGIVLLAFGVAGLIVCVICSVFGTIMIRRASSNMVAAGWDMNTNKQIIVQVFSIFLGIIAFVFLTVIDADLLAGQWKFLIAIQVLLLILLRIFGQDDGTGNYAWIRFAGIGIQPSEIIKVLYIVVAAKQMTWLKEYQDINSFKSVVLMAGYFVLVFGAIVVVSSDLGSASIILCIFLTMFFALVCPDFKIESPYLFTHRCYLPLLEIRLSFHSRSNTPRG